MRSKKPFKTVKKEALIVSWVSLIGIVGGTLGLFVEFSFIGALEWVFGKISSLGKICKQDQLKIDILFCRCLKIVYYIILTAVAMIFVEQNH